MLLPNLIFVDRDVAITILEADAVCKHEGFHQLEDIAELVQGWYPDLKITFRGMMEERYGPA